MYAQTPVPGRQVRVIRAPRSTGVREDENALLVVHKRLRVGEVGRAGAVLDAKPLALAHDPSRTTGYLRNRIRAKPLHDLVERALYGCERCKPFDQPVAAFNGVTA